ncbi:MAG: serine/threonine-protein phosphatase [Lachnospiraceae bacterium]|nr:serine/threonine-protein phosphatase [Lachnospiraceae bacterium]
MNSAAVQNYIKTVTLEENQKIVEAIKKMEKERPMISVGAAADIGQRENQQDSSFGQAEQETAFGVVCDGMGGLAGGEMASQTAVQTLIEDYYDKTTSDMGSFWKQEAYRLNDIVSGLKDDNGKSLNAGSTLVAVSIEQNRLNWVSVGDSRIYRIRGDVITQLNPEHNYKATLDAKLALGEITNDDYLADEDRAEALTSFLGIGKLKLVAQNREVEMLQSGDVILLCSDGLYKALEDELIVEVVKSALPNVQLAANRLIDATLAKKVNQQDNVSVVLLQYL